MYALYDKLPKLNDWNVLARRPHFWGTTPFLILPNLKGHFHTIFPSLCLNFGDNVLYCLYQELIFFT